MKTATERQKRYDDFKVIIPARYESSRFPGKPLAEINGTTMIEHVYRRALNSDAAEVIVATDDERIAEEAIRIGADIEITSREHASGSDRIREVAENRDWDEDTSIVNVQGDSPLISPRSINQVAQIVQLHGNCVGTLATRITTREDFHNTNIVKVVWDNAGRALYFSRAPIPHQDDRGYSVWAWRHLGIYCYPLKYLRAFTGCGTTHLENDEKLEQLRFLALNIPVRVQVADDPHGVDVDVPADVKVVEDIMTEGASSR